MEIQPPPIKMPSPTLSNSPEALSHHSSPAKTSRICYQPHPQMITPQHQMIDERTSGSRIPLSISTHHQLASAAIGTPGDHPHSSISGISGIHSDVNVRFKICLCIFWVIVCAFFFSNAVWFGTSTSVPKFSDHPDISDYRRTSFSIIISFITSSSSPSFGASTIAKFCASTFAFATCHLYTATRNQSVRYQFIFMDFFH